MKRFCWKCYQVKDCSCVLGAERKVRRGDGHNKCVRVELESSRVQPESRAETRFSRESWPTGAVSAAVREVSDHYLHFQLNLL